MLKEKSDIELLDLYIATKERKALSELFLRHADIAFRTAMRVTKNAADAEDVVQIAFIELIKNIQNFRQEGSFLSWFLKIVSHRSIDQLRSDKRRMKRESQAMKQVYYEDKPLETEETQKKIVENHLLNLPSIYREPIYMKIVEGLSTGEISKLLSKPEKTIRTQISRGLEQLKLSLKSSGAILTIPLITSVLSSIELQAAPKSLTNNSNIDKLANQIELKSELSSGLFASILKASFVVVSISAISIFAYFKLNQPNQSLASLQNQSVTEETNREKKVFYTEFEDESSLSIFSVQNGGFEIAKNDGVNKSHAAVISTHTILSIDISQFKLPVKISYDYDTFLPKPGEKSGSRFEMYKPQDVTESLHLFINIGGLKKIDYIPETRVSKHTGKWNKTEMYLFKDRVETWSDDRMIGVLFFTPTNEVVIAKVEKTYIDNFKIEEIDAEYSQLDQKVVDIFRGLHEKIVAENRPFGMHQAKDQRLKEFFSKDISFSKFRYDHFIRAFENQTAR